MTRYCENCGCDVQEGVQVFPGPLRKECAECGSTGPFMAENPHYDPGTDEHRAGRPSPPIAAREPWWKILGTLALPWVVVGYVSWVGFRWTVIGLGAVYLVALLLAIGVAIGAERG